MDKLQAIEIANLGRNGDEPVIPYMVNVTTAGRLENSEDAETGNLEIRGFLECALGSVSKWCSFSPRFR